MVLKYYGVNQYGQDRIANCDRFNQTGTHWKKMVQFLDLHGPENGFSVSVQNGTVSELKTCIANDRPVIVRQWNNTEHQSRHYRVVTGYNDPKKEFILLDPQSGSAVHMNYATFQELWHIQCVSPEWASNNLMILIRQS